MKTAKAQKAGSGTVHLVQSFRREGRALKADPQQKFKTPDAAIATAKRLADRKVGVVAFSLEVDNEADFTGEPMILFRAGQVPGELEDA